MRGCGCVSDKENEHWNCAEEKKDGKQHRCFLANGSGQTKLCISVGWLYVVKLRCPDSNSGGPPCCGGMMGKQYIQLDFPSESDSHAHRMCFWSPWAGPCALISHRKTLTPLCPTKFPVCESFCLFHALHIRLKALLLPETLMYNMVYMTSIFLIMLLNIWIALAMWWGCAGRSWWKEKTSVVGCVTEGSRQSQDWRHNEDIRCQFRQFSRVPPLLAT